MIDIPEAIQAKACDAVRKIMRLELFDSKEWIKQRWPDLYEMALRWAISETAREALGEQLTELQNDAVPRIWLAQTANVLNLYFHGYVPKDVAGPLLAKIEANWPGTIDPIQELAPCLAGDYDL